MLMRRVGASYERWGKAKMQGVRFEKLTDYRELLSIPKSITHLNWKAERGKDYQWQEITPHSIQVIQPGECAPMFVGVHLYLPLGRVTCRKVRRFSLYLLSLVIPCAERQQRA
jgi:hypothetical protein